MEFKDYYQTLGLDKSATQDEIKRAYRKLARKYHPDISKEPNAEAQFKELGEAYEVLKDPEKRAAYDKLGQNWQRGQEFEPPPDWDAGFEFSGGGFTDAGPEAFSDFFENLFGQRFHSGRTQHQGGFSPRGQDHHAKILIELEDAFTGARRQISLQHPQLDAAGRVQLQTRTLNVTIPKGIKPGQNIRLAGQGEPGPSGDLPGDLYLEVEFKPHRLFTLDGRDLHIELPLAPWEAALGTKVKLPTPAGTVELTVPANSQGGQKLRLKGRGLPGKTQGDLYARLTIAVPPQADESTRALYRQLQEQSHYNPRAHWENKT